MAWRVNKVLVKGSSHKRLSKLVCVATPEEAAGPLKQWLSPGDHLLLKASRGIALERLIPLLG